MLSGSDVNEANIIDALSKMARSPGVRPAVSLLITFKTNSAELTPEATEQLAVAGAAFNNERLIKYGFSIEGHADPRGNSAANLALSQRRAESVRRYLLATQGIEPQRLIAQGKGDREVLNRANPAAPENRRVTFVTRWQ